MECESYKVEWRYHASTGAMVKRRAETRSSNAAAAWVALLGHL